MPCPRVTRNCVELGLGHAEFFAGIPGTMGGALAMNAGAYGGETWSYVRAVDVIGARWDLSHARGQRVPRRLPARGGAGQR